MQYECIPGWSGEIRWGHCYDFLQTGWSPEQEGDSNNAGCVEATWSLTWHSLASCIDDAAEGPKRRPLYFSLKKSIPLQPPEVTFLSLTPQYSQRMVKIHKTHITALSWCYLNATASTSFSIISVYHYKVGVISLGWFLPRGIVSTVNTKRVGN